jgi:hypothetical protein
MHKIVESKVVYVLACISIFMAISICAFTGSAMPAFGGGVLPGPQPTEISQSPFPPPDPGDPWLTIAQSPFPPPDPGDPWLTIV